MVTAVRPVVRITAAEPWHPRLRKNPVALRQLNKVQDEIQDVVKQHLLGTLDAGVASLSQLDASAYHVAVRRVFDKAAQPFASSLMLPLLKAMDLGAKVAQQDLPDSLVPQKAQEIDSSWSVYDPIAVEFAQTQSMAIVKGISDTTVEQLQNALAAGIEAGLSRDEIATNMREEVGADISKWRARTIAQTEVIRAHTKGSLALYDKSGVVSQVRWLDGQPGACPFCQGLSGQTVDLGEEFDSDLGSTDGPPLHPGCRCTVTAVLGRP